MTKHKSTSMFTRLMVLFLAVIFVVVGCLTVILSVTLRQEKVNGRQEELMRHARELAYLAAQQEELSLIGSLSPYFSSYDEKIEKTARNKALGQYISWKMQVVQQDFGAMIIIADGSFRTLYTSIRDDGTLKDTFNIDEVAALLVKAMQGLEGSTRLTLPDAQGGSVFTVCVPVMKNGYTNGVVLIHTSAQVIEAEYRSLLWQVLVGVALATLLAIVLVSLFARQTTKPLHSMALAAKAMSRGDFDHKAEETGVQEVRELAVAFNTMAGQLKELETSRREFVANVSHELRSPMTSIHGFIQGMLDGTIPLEERDKYLKIVGDETTRLSKLIADLLSLSRMEQAEERLTVQDFDINEMIRRALIRRMNDLDCKAIEVDVRFEEEQCYAQGDPDRIEQVVVNLLDNAIKFTPEKGHIMLETKTENKQVAVTVADDGEGILPEDRDKVFDRFYKAEKAHTAGKGTGLGLSICKRILDDHGQEIQCLPRDEGAAFRFTLAQGKKPPRV